MAIIVMAAAGASAECYGWAMLTVETSFGPVPLCGDFERFDAGRPLMLVIRGAFARKDQAESLAQDLPEADAVFAHLPGMHSPHFAEPGIEAFGWAFDEAMTQAFGARPFVKVGVSIGGLVVMVMRRGEATVCLDTPLSTAPVWTVRNRVRQDLRNSADDAFRTWAWNLFGVSEAEAVNRDYRPLVVTAKRPLTFVIAGEPLEVAESDRSPGLISAEDREYLRGFSDMRRVTVEGSGHNLLATTPETIVREVRFSLIRGGLVKPA